MTPNDKKDAAGAVLDIERQQKKVESLGWTKDEAAEVRARLGAFAEDWDRPDMDVYDDL